MQVRRLNAGRVILELQWFGDVSMEDSDFNSMKNYTYGSITLPSTDLLILQHYFSATIILLSLFLDRLQYYYSLDRVCLILGLIPFLRPSRCVSVSPHAESRNVVCQTAIGTSCLQEISHQS